MKAGSVMMDVRYSQNNNAETSSSRFWNMVAMEWIMMAVGVEWISSITAKHRFKGVIPVRNKSRKFTGYGTHTLALHYQSISISSI